MNAVTVSLPIPPASLSPNGRATLRERLGDKIRYRVDCAWAVKAEIGWEWEPWLEPVRVHVVWQTPNAAHLPDADNAIARLKQAIDAAQDAGLYVNDKQISGITVERVVGPRGLTVTFSREEQP